jgi:hypothetical protein
MLNSELLNFKWISIGILGVVIHVLPRGAQSLPATAEETFRGKPIALANDVRGKPALIVIGFSKESSHTGSVTLRHSLL